MLSYSQFEKQLAIADDTETKRELLSKLKLEIDKEENVETRAQLEALFMLWDDGESIEPHYPTIETTEGSSVVSYPKLEPVDGGDDDTIKPIEGGDFSMVVPTSSALRFLGINKAEQFLYSLRATYYYQDKHFVSNLDKSFLQPLLKYAKWSNEGGKGDFKISREEYAKYCRVVEQFRVFSERYMVIRDTVRFFNGLGEFGEQYMDYVDLKLDFFHSEYKAAFYTIKKDAELFYVFTHTSELNNLFIVEEMVVQ